MASEATGLSGIAERYATALYDLADETKALDAVAQDLRNLKNLIDGSPDLRRFLRSPLIGRQAQTKGMTRSERGSSFSASPPMIRNRCW